MWILSSGNGENNDVGVMGDSKYPAQMMILPSTTQKRKARRAETSNSCKKERFLHM